MKTPSGNPGTASHLRNTLASLRDQMQEWLRLQQQLHQEKCNYRAKGICQDCGACSAKEAETRCKPQRDACNEYTCAGKELWEPRSLPTILRQANPGQIKHQSWAGRDNPRPAIVAL